MGPTAKSSMIVSMPVAVVEWAQWGGGRTNTISAVPSVMNSIDTPNSVDVPCVAVLNMLLEKGEGEGQGGVEDRDCVIFAVGRRMLSYGLHCSLQWRP